MKPEQMLQAIIQKQVEGGCDKFECKGYCKIKPWGGVELQSNGFSGTLSHVLLILLDTEGCKAVYGDTWYCEDCGNGKYGRCADSTCPFNLSGTYVAPHKILEAWNSGEGNNYKKAIETAYNLL